MLKKPSNMRLGIVLNDYPGALDTADLPDPFNAVARPGTLPGSFANPAFWPVPTAYAAAPGTTGMEMIDGTSSAIHGIAEAIRRLAPHCDLIVGQCGYMYAARSQIPLTTPTLLSGLELLPNALASTPRPVGVLTFNRLGTEKMLAGHPDLSRLRIVGVDDQPSWSVIWEQDLITKQRLNHEQMRVELLEVCMRERRNGAFSDIGALVLECTAMPQFRRDIVSALRLPVWDIAAVAKALLGA